MSDLNPTPEFKNDHDVLVALYVEQKQMKLDVKELKDNTNNRVQDLEREKADQDDLEALQKAVEKQGENITFLYRLVWMGGGALTAVQVYMQFFRN